MREFGSNSHLELAGDSDCSYVTPNVPSTQGYVFYYLGNAGI